MLKAIVFLFFISVCSGYAQEVRYVGSGKVLFEEYVLDKPSEIFSVIRYKASDGVMASFSRYKSNRTLSFITSATGGFIVGWSLVGVISGREELNVGLLAGGAGLAGFGILINNVANKHLERAIDLYNDDGSVYRMHFRAGCSQNGVGLFVSF